jgi:acetolactate synthase regulatory subunit
MQWLLTLETERDPIVICRLMNIFRRKGLSIETMALAAKPEGYSCITVVDTPGTEIDHIFNYLRSTEGVFNVACYRHEPTSAASYVFVESTANPESVSRILETLPGSKVIFASHGKYLFEIRSEGHLPPSISGLGEPGFLPLSRVKTSRQSSQMELVGAMSS